MSGGSDDERYAVNDIDEPLHSAFVRLGQQSVAASDYAMLGYLGADFDTISASLGQCNTWDEAMSWAKDLSVEGALNAEDSNPGYTPSMSVGDAASWSRFMDEESGESYYQPLAEDGSSAGEVVWSETLAASVVESLAPEQWVLQLDDDTGHRFYLYAGGGEPTTSNEVGAWQWEDDLIAAHLHVASGSSAEQPPSPQGQSPIRGTTVAELKRNFDGAATPKRTRRQLEAAASVTKDQLLKMLNANKVSSALEEALRKATAMSELGDAMHRDGVTCELARQCAAMSRWEAAHELRQWSVPHVVPEVMPADEALKLPFCSLGPTPHRTGNYTGVRNATPLHPDHTSSFHTTLLLHHRDGRTCLYNDFLQGSLNVTIQLGNTAGMMLCGQNVKETMTTERAAEIAFEAVVGPGRCLDVFAMTEEGMEAEVYPDVVCLSAKVEAMTQKELFDASEALRDINEALTDRVLQAVATKHHGNRFTMMRMVQETLRREGPGIVADSDDPQAPLRAFIDPEFPPCLASFGCMPIARNHPACAFRHITHVMRAQDQQNLALVRRGVRPPGDYHVSQLGDCSVIAALSSLTHTQPARVSALFEGTTQRDVDSGRATITITDALNGLFRNTSVDFYMPASLHELTAAHNPWDAAELCPGVVEKTFAKIAGSYGALYATHGISEAMSALTGAPSSTMRPDPVALLEAVEKKYPVLLVAAGTTDAVATGLVPGHPYVVLAADTCGNDVVLKLRDPSGAGDVGCWNGPAPTTMDTKDLAPGFCGFHISWIDVKQHFAVMHICSTTPDATNDYRVSFNATPLGRLVGDGVGCLHTGGLRIRTSGTPAGETLLNDTDPSLAVTVTATIWGGDDDSPPPAVLALHSLEKQTGKGRGPTASRRTSVQLEATSGPQASHQLSFRTNLRKGSEYFVGLAPLDMTHPGWVGVLVTFAVQCAAVMGENISAHFVRPADNATAAMLIRSALKEGPRKGLPVCGPLTLHCVEAPYQLRQGLDTEAKMTLFGSSFSPVPSSIPPIRDGAFVEVPNNRECLASTCGPTMRSKTKSEGKVVRAVQADTKDSSSYHIQCELAESDPAREALLAELCSEFRNHAADKTPLVMDAIAERLGRALGANPALGSGWFVVVGSAISASFTAVDGMAAIATFGNVEVVAVRPIPPRSCFACSERIATKCYDFRETFGASVHLAKDCLESFRIHHAPRCFMCKEPIRTWVEAGVEVADGMVHAGECHTQYLERNIRRCVQCGEPLGSSFLVADDRPEDVFHDECEKDYRRSRAPKCAICNEPLDSEFYDTAIGMIHPGECYAAYKNREAEAL